MMMNCFLKIHRYKKYLREQVVVPKEIVLLRLEAYKELNCLVFDNESIIFPEIMYCRNLPLKLVCLDYDQIVGIRNGDKYVYIVLRDGYIHAIGKKARFHSWVNVMRFANSKLHLKRNYFSYSFIFGDIFIDAVEQLTG